MTTTLREAVLGEFNLLRTGQTFVFLGKFFARNCHRYMVLDLELLRVTDFRTIPVDPSGRLGDLWYREGGLIRSDFIERTIVRIKPASYLASFSYENLPESCIVGVRCTTRQFSILPKDNFQVWISFDLVLNANTDLLVRLSKMLKVDLQIQLIPEQQDLLENESSPQSEIVGL